MPVRIEKNKNLTTAFLSGEIDHHSSAFLREEIDKAVNVVMPRELCLDFMHVSFMDSSGIAVIARTRYRMQSLNGRIWIECPSPQVQRVLDAAGIERLVPVTSGNIGGVR